jgi:hypothetical protein
MVPTHQFCVDRIKTCVLDLSENGIDLRDADDRQLASTVREHLEYFQLMLGYDSDPGEILQLLKERAQPA